MSRLSSWGSTYGPVEAAVNELLKEGRNVAHVHLRNLSPLPDGLEGLLKGFKHVLVVEMNKGQLRRLIRSEFLIPAEGLNQVSGRPFTVAKVKIGRPPTLGFLDDKATHSQRTLQPTRKFAGARDVVITQF